MISKKNLLYWSTRFTIQSLESMIIKYSGVIFQVKAYVATQDRVFPHYVPNSSIKHSKSDSKDRSQEILWSVKQ
jgi:hypothetical protein